MPAHSGTERPGTLEGPARQLALFVGGSKDGQTIMVPFEDGALCISVEMQPQVVLQRQPRGKRSLKLPIHLENYIQRAVDHNGRNSRRFAISLNLQLTRYCDQVELLEDQLSGEAAQMLRAAIRAQVASIGGRILPAAIGHEDVLIELTSSDEYSTLRKSRPILRGECWVVTPALPGTRYSSVSVSSSTISGLVWQMVPNKWFWLKFREADGWGSRRRSAPGSRGRRGAGCAGSGHHPGALTVQPPTAGRGERTPTGRGDDKSARISRGRDGPSPCSFGSPPAQIPASGTTALGSCLG